MHIFQNGSIVKSIVVLCFFFFKCVKISYEMFDFDLIVVSFPYFFWDIFIYYIFLLKRFFFGWKKLNCQQYMREWTNIKPLIFRKQYYITILRLTFLFIIFLLHLMLNALFKMNIIMLLKIFIIIAVLFGII